MEKRKALFSVSDKDGIIEFAQDLIALDFEIYASGGTARHLSTNGIPVTDIAVLVGGGPILGHRVVTLSREIAAALLAKKDDADQAEMKKLGLPYIDLVCIDLYPLQAEINKPDAKPEAVLEQTDIGGVNVIRAAAKGRRIVVCDKNDRPEVIRWLKAGSLDKDEVLTASAAKAEYVAAQYSLISAAYTSQGKYAGVIGERVMTCKYGENAYQAPAALYRNPLSAGDPLSLDKFQVVAGDALSYNNLCDLDRLLQTVTHIAAAFDLNYGETPFIAIGDKHGNSCGIGVDYGSPGHALCKMLAGDPVSLFGGLIMLNFAVTKEIANRILLNEDGGKRLLDGICAPHFDKEAIEILNRKKGKCRLTVNAELIGLDRDSLDTSPLFRQVRAGFLEQPNYTFILNLKDANLKSYGPPLKKEDFMDIILAKAICDTSNSNTITIVKDGMLLANGVGQQSRVRAAKFALAIAAECEHEVKGAVAASDSFFPYTDGPQALQEAGIKAIITSSGSVRDPEVIEFCEKNKVSLLMIPDSMGRGFYNH